MPTFFTTLMTYLLSSSLLGLGAIPACAADCTNGINPSGTCASPAGVSFKVWGSGFMGASSPGGAPLTDSRPGATDGCPRLKDPLVPGITACNPVDLADASVTANSGSALAGGVASDAAAGSPGREGLAPTGKEHLVGTSLAATAVPVVAAAMPTPGEWILLLLASLLGAAAWRLSSHQSGTQRT